MCLHLEVKIPVVILNVHSVFWRLMGQDSFLYVSLYLFLFCVLVLHDFSLSFFFFLGGYGWCLQHEEVLGVRS